MNVLVLNGSPKKVSDTMRLTSSFLEGLAGCGDCNVTVVDVISKDIRPCMGCFGCWRKGDGRCVQQDDQNEILAAYLAADVIIWSFPLYCYGMPSHLKTVLDRVIPLVKMNMREVDGKVQHVQLFDLSKKRTVVISGAGFPDWEGNFEGLRGQCKNCFGSPIMICVPETPLMNIPEASPVAELLLEKFRLAGAEFAASGCLAPETVQALETPMIPREEYIRRINTDAP